MNLSPMIPDALSIEYKRDYGCACGETKLLDIVNYPPIASEFRRLGLRRHEEFLHLILGDLRSFRDDATDASLIGSKSI